MRVRRFMMVVAGVWAFAPASVSLLHAQSVPAANPMTSACGTEDTRFKMKRDGLNAETPPAAGMARIYVIELMPSGFATTHVKVGADGHWLAQLSGQNFIGFDVDPGVHHLCAQYQGNLATPLLGDTILHRVNAEAGKTYFLLYRAFISRDAGQIGFFDLVDEDEGRYALLSADHVTATVVKK